MINIENLANGEFLKRKDGAKKVFIKKEYCRFNKAYACQNWDDISDIIYLKKGKQVFINFEF
jgi:hypothetical protein